MGNVERIRKSWHETPLPVASATVIEVGDLVYYSGGAVLPASTPGLWDTNEATTQAALKAAFVGVAKSASKAGETKDVVVAFGAVCEYPCTSATYAFGSFVSSPQDGANLYLKDQELKASIAAGGIGIVSREYASAVTMIEVVLISKLAQGIVLA